MKYKKMIFLPVIIGISLSIVLYLSQSSQDHSEEIDVNSLIDIETSQDIESKKIMLESYIWKDDQTFKSKLPSDVQYFYTDKKFDDFQNVERIDRIYVKMNYDVDSTAYMFFPKNPNNELLIYHQGHRGDITFGKSTIEFFLNKGYTILAFSMPLIGENSKPIVHIDELDENLFLDSHDKLRFLESSTFSPIKFFLEPIYVSLNYIESEFNFSSYNFIGISGGGWTAVVYSSFDDRISKTISVAGSLPFYLRTSPENFGDYEQKIPEFYDIANYLELYIMSAYGFDRGLLQIFNEFDPCCFSGTEYVSYENIIKNKISKLKSGTFKIELDKTNKEHSISSSSLQKSLIFLKNSID
ncbi:hypothetical protein CL659_02875 [bacterium]|nr:hypothetical protein [bacterium]|tara:strand:- start:14973 stop:16037 length:1065 start_codon:yes stop_codon:yes gene_type:complete